MNVDKKRSSTEGAAELVSGVIIGILLAGIGLVFWHEALFPTPRPEVKIVEKTIVRRVVVEKPVVQERVVEKETILKEGRLYRAVQLGANGEEINSWIIKKCKFKTIGAILTDAADRVFEVRGNIKIEPVR